LCGNARGHRPRDTSSTVHGDAVWQIQDSPIPYRRGNARGHRPRDTSSTVHGDAVWQIQDSPIPYRRGRRMAGWEARLRRLA
jgi:hypothetical protein